MRLPTPATRAACTLLVLLGGIIALLSAVALMTGRSTEHRLEAWLGLAIGVIAAVAGTLTLARTR